jgi:hypothetical protein
MVDGDWELSACPKTGLLLIELDVANGFWPLPCSEKVLFDGEIASGEVMCF